MTRKTFPQILREAKVNIPKEYERLGYLIYYNVYQYNKYDDSLKGTVVDEIRNKFTKLRCCGTAVSLDDFTESHGFIIPNEIQDNEIDILISFCEYWYNIFQDYLELTVSSVYSGEIYFGKVILDIQERINLILEKVSYTIVKEDNFYSFVEKSPAAVSAAEVIEDQSLSIETLMYNHHSMKGDIVGKRTVLNKMAQYLEPRRKTLETVDKKLANDLFNIFNNFNIRHNNIDPSDTGKFNQKCADMKNEELEALYDDTYQMWLLAILEIDNIDRKERIKTILE